MDKNLVTADEISIAECYAFQDTTAFEINGWTTDATRYIKIYTPTTPTDERHDGKWSTSGYRHEPSDSSCISLRENFINIHGIQFGTTPSASHCYALYWNNITGAGIYKVTDCIVKSTAQSVKIGRGLY